MLHQQPVVAITGNHTRPKGADAAGGGFWPAPAAVFTPGNMARAFFCLSLAAALLLGSGHAGAEPEANLLARQKTKLKHWSDIRLPAHELRALADNNTATACTLLLTKERPFDIVYAFGGEVLTPAKLEVQLAGESGSNSVVAQVEILTSIVSEQVGYQLLRQDTVRALNKPQLFDFPPTGAKWIMLRFKAPDPVVALGVAEVKVLGFPGPPKTRYAFKESPASALQVLGKLKKVSGEFSITPDESDLFQDAQDGKLDRWSFGESVLLASGIREKKDRLAYLAKLDALEAEARKSLGKGKKTFAEAEKLLPWLHARTLAGGYQSEQTDVSTTLDQQTFNCVSSSVLYNLLGRRLGLDVRAVEVPDHVFSIVYDGVEHADVETTTPEGFNPARDPDVIRQFANLTGFVYLPEEHKDSRREIRETGLTGIVYYNHGVGLLQQKKYHEALLAFLRALNLDAELFSAIHNVLVALAHWGADLAGEKKYDEAVKVVGAGLELAPQDASLGYAQKAVWFLWADSFLDGGDSAAALDIFKRAHQAVPDAGFDALQAWAFVRPANDLVQKGQWEKALRLTESTGKQVAPAARAELEKWRAALYFGWSAAELEKKRYAQAAAVLAEAMRALPAEKRYQYNLGYVIQEWAEDAWKKGGLQPAKNILAKMLKKYPAVPEVKQVVVGFVGRVLESLAASKAYEQQALAVIEAFGPLLEKKGEVRDLIRYVYDSLAEKYKQRQQWEQAVGVYQKALALYPQDEHLRHNTAVAWDGWISMFVRRGRWEEALKVCEKASGQKLEEQHFLEKTGYVVQEYAEVICRQQGSEKAEALLERMLAKYPDNSHVQQAAGGYFQRRLQEIKHDPRHEQKAAAIMARSQKILSDQQTVQKLDKNRYDEMAGVYLAGKKWQDAIAVYKTALKHYPEDKHVLNNAIAVWDAWNNDCVARKDWEQALTVCEQAAQQPLDPNHFTNNQLFTMQEYLKDAFAAGGLTKSAGVLSNLLRRFYSLAGVQEMALGHFQYVLSSLNSRDPKTCENEGRKVILKGKGILKDEQAAKKLAYVLYDRLAQEAGSRGQWEEAVALYNRALQQYPADAHLLGNLAVSWNQWAQTYISRQEWKKAIGVYEKALKAVPGNSMLQNNLEYCKEKSKL